MMHKSNIMPATSHGTVLRSATRSDLQVPRTRLMFGERTFSVAAPKALNNLPVHIRTAVNILAETENIFIL